MAWSEDSLHRWLAQRARPAGLVGAMGDDAALLERMKGSPVVCCDQTIEGVHFLSGTDGRTAGAKAVCRSLSDLAASAATPRAVLLAISAPADAEEEWLLAAIQGVHERGAEFGAELVGGDLSCAPGAAQLVVTAFGEFAGEASPGRDRAREGQSIVATGPVGGSAAARHLALQPRVPEGLWLHSLGATAMMDVSDGLAWDLYRMARSSGVQFEVDNVPIHADAHDVGDGESAEWHALHDGEDHELIATLDGKALERALREKHEHCPELVVIGHVRAGSGLYLGQPGNLREWNPGEGGWRHGS
jgi:thiamine-monophosphate kinase